MSDETAAVIEGSRPQLSASAIDAQRAVAMPQAPPAMPATMAPPARDGHFRRMQFAKRCTDIVIAGVALLLLLPLGLCIAIAIKLDSAGPIFYKQRRVGQNGRVFGFYKFRSMVAGADDLRPALSDQNDHDRGPIFKMREDPRKTRVGTLLRRFSLDELPQLFNVLRGDMSMVGPRPALETELHGYAPWHYQRMLVPQGMTGLWQVGGRSELNFQEMMDLDLSYVQQWNFLSDIRVLLRTIPVVLSGRGAY